MKTTMDGKRDSGAHDFETLFSVSGGYRMYEKIDSNNISRVNSL